MLVGRSKKFLIMFKTNLEEVKMLEGEFLSSTKREVLIKYVLIEEKKRVIFPFLSMRLLDL